MPSLRLCTLTAALFAVSLAAVAPDEGSCSDGTCEGEDTALMQTAPAAPAALVMAARTAKGVLWAGYPPIVVRNASSRAAGLASLHQERSGAASSCTDGALPSDWACSGGACTCAQLKAGGHCPTTLHGVRIAEVCCQTCCRDDDSCLPQAWRCGASPNLTACTCGDLEDYCNDPAYEKETRAACPRTCNLCGSPPTPPPTAPPADSCRDHALSGWTCNGENCTCASMKAWGACSATAHGVRIAEVCCQSCCLDDSHALPPEWRCGSPPSYSPCTCKGVKGYCSDPTFGRETRAACPKTCGLCGSRRRKNSWWPFKR